MRRLLAVHCLGLYFLSGCALCCAPYDCDYHYLGGRWIRTNPSSGRVGSVFDPAGEPVEVPPEYASEPTPAEVTPEPLPLPAAEGQSVIPKNLGESYLP